MNATLCGLTPRAFLRCSLAHKKGCPLQYVQQYLGTDHVPCFPVNTGCDKCQSPVNCVESILCVYRSFFTVWMVGDSFIHEVFISLMCLVEQSPGIRFPTSVKVGARQSSRMREPTFVEKCVTFVRERTPSKFRMCHVRITPYITNGNFKCGHSFQCVSTSLSQHDFILVNFGLWYHGPRSDQLLQDAESIAQEILERRRTRPHATFIWVQTTARCFPTTSSAYEANLPSPRCADLFHAVMKRSHIQDSADHIMRSTTDETISAWTLSTVASKKFLVGHNALRGTLDCTHWWMHGLPTVVAKLALQVMNSPQPLR
mmetsp:Transcript_42885/g.81797  ORF Transcript_42885/g.81797 Transcript_42885/m.81797 type:complete len:315 (+) Transcript_42885:1259-2203(+)